jgi:anaerobic selenocysteine-containing dehydrogenase
MGMLYVILSEGLYDQDFVNRWCYGLVQLKERVAEYPLEQVEQITGIPAEAIANAARLYASHKSATIISGRGVDQIGCNSAQTMRALAILRAVTGNVDIPGASHLTEMPDFIPEVELELSDRLSPAQRKKQLGTDRVMRQTYRGYELARK